MLAGCVGSPAEPDPFDSMLTKCIEPPALTPSEYIARLESLVRDFMPAEPELTCTTMRWWVDRAVAHLCTRDVHPASTTTH